MKRKIASLLILILATILTPLCEAAGVGFLIEPSDVVVSNNEAAILDCQVKSPSGNSFSNSNIKWKRDGEFINFPDFNNYNRRRLLSNGSLYISEVHHTRTNRPDEGFYQCVASIDGIGTLISRTATLKVSGLSTSFTFEPEDIKVILGDTAVFECDIQSVNRHSDRHVEVQWFRDQQHLQLDHRMKVMPSGMLEIRDVSVSDLGSYNCQARGELGDVRTSRSADLKINLASPQLPTPPKFIIPPRNSKVEEGQTVHMDCAANSNPAPFISWLKDGATIDLNHLDSRFIKVGTGSLQIKDVRVEDEGTYQCRAENSEDSVDSAAFLEVQVKPKFIKTPKDKEAFVKGDIEFECEVYSKPKATVQWYKNGDLIIESDYFQIIRGTNLKILGLVEDDSGVYQCFASNSLGNIQAAAQLQVNQKASDPEIPNLSKSKHFSPISNANAVHSSIKNKNPILTGDMVFKKGPSAPKDVQAVIVSTRFITLSWSKPEIANGDIQGYSVFYKDISSDRERVLNSTRGNLEELNVQGLQPGTRYVLRVLAHNQHGNGDSSPPLTVSTQDELDVPGPVKKLKCRPTSSFSILISWGKPSYSKSLVKSYKLYYRVADEMKTESVDVRGLQYHLTDLREFTEYTFWVSAFNINGEGSFSEEVSTRTYSDIPADPPQNVTLEADSSQSLIIRWEPPPKESQNGIITGYKIRWKKEEESRGKSEIYTTDGSRRLYAITGLSKGHGYQVKISAMTVNGTGPSTPWQIQRTFDSDLDESVVPAPPSSIKAKAKADEIEITWTPPRNNKILVRGYTIGWGKGIPDEFTDVVDDKERLFVIRNLKPNSEYVISLRAYNNIGDGRPIYETLRTKTEEEIEPSTPFEPPYGLHARVLSSTSALLTWIDSSLPKNQVIPDNRYYVVRYTTSKSLKTHKPKHQYKNSTRLNIMLDDLMPNTEYEFVVRVVKGRRRSRWSMVNLNATQEDAPDSPPRDLTIRMKKGSPNTLILNWRPPKYPNGKINGYVIQYTTNRKAEEREWSVEPIMGDESMAIIQNLIPHSKYYFKIGARNSKGYGPYGPVTSFTIPGHAVINAIDGSASMERPAANEEVSPVILYAVAGVGAGIMIVVIIGAAILIHRCGQNSGAAAVVANDRLNKNSYMSSESTLGGQKERLNPPPPDLWMGHDQLELKSMDDGDETGETSIARSTPIDYRSASSMDRSRNYIMPYSGTESEMSFSVAGSSICRGSSILNNKSKRAFDQRQLLLPMQSSQAGKPVKIAAINGKPRVQRYLSHESVASSVPGSSCNGSSSTYIRSQYNLNPPPPIPLSEDDLPPPGYEPSITAPSESAPSTIEEANANWSLIQGSNPDGASTLSGVGMAVAPPQLPPTYLSSAMSTSSADSSSGSGSGATRSSRQSSSTNTGGSCNPGVKSSNLKSFSANVNANNMQPKHIVRPQATSPFKKHLLSANTSLLNANSLMGKPSILGSTAETAPTSTSLTTSAASASGTPLHSGQLPSIGNVRSPEVLHPQEGPCNCLSHPIMPSLSTEELNAEMKNLEGLMKDLSVISTPNSNSSNLQHSKQNQC